ncbi:uncharacterized protein LOC129170430 isoform X3 [Dunckerocampus dactyliophorus]|uniref:uncharacterized protein LOC129170430 isoform X3 n=1 Tax=Dunckerocampus dactyliophorus TaxID=161453 RepID=UPI0024060329|nr:uncharacterized protein LOC129170430 isoform X3 [Dunckerocampus dactyliophorus]
MRVQSVFVLQVCALLIFLPPASLSEVTCDALLIMAANASSLQPWSTWNETQNNGSGRVIGSGLYCDASVDGIGTCWPRSAAGHMVSRPCPEMFYGVRYNTTNSVYRKCLANGTWAAKGNYSMCKAILHQEEHPLPEEHHPLEPHRRLHPQEHHVVRGAAHNEPRGARKQRGVVPPGYGFLQLLPLHQLLLDVWGRVLPAHRHRAHLLHRQAAQVDVHLHRLVYPVPHHRGLGHREALLRQREVLVWEASRRLHRLHLPGSNDPRSGDQLHFPLQHRPDPHDQTASVHHVRDHPVQESREGHAGAPPAAGNHLHAVLRQSRRRRDLADRLHLFQLLLGVFPGILCVRLLLLPKQ